MTRLPLATYSALADDDHNMLVQAQWPQQTREFLDYLQRETRALEQAVVYHLSLPSREACTVEPLAKWASGSFNICIPIRVKYGNNNYRVAVRCPWPHRMQSPTSPDMASEKIRSEAATYAWLSAHCPRVPIPQLLGFGLSNGRSFTPLRAFFDAEYWRPFAPSSSPVLLRTGYFITDFIEPEQGTMLIHQWPSQKPAHRQTLFRSLANIMLDLIRIPLPRIGSFTVHDSGQVTLSSRPLTASLALMECEGIPSDMAPDTTYESVDTYLEDLLHCHDTRMIHQPKAVEGRFDAEGQLATIVLWKAIRSHFTDRNLRHGPFALQLTDLHNCNIYVDEQYNITAIIDLEWTCSLPLEMLQPPFWISGHIQDDFVGATEIVTTNEKALISGYGEFLDIFSQEQASRSLSQKPALNADSIIRAAFEKKSHWYFAGLKHPRVAYSFLVGHMQPFFAPAHLFPDHVLAFDRVLAPYYMRDFSQFVDQKLKEKAQYDEALRELFREEGKAI